MNQAVQIDRRLPTHELNARRNRLRVLFAPATARPARCDSTQQPQPARTPPPVPPESRTKAVYIIH